MTRALLRWITILALLLPLPALAGIDVVYRYNGVPSLSWQHNPGTALFDSEPVAGGVLRLAASAAPQHLRRFGPDSATAAAHFINRQQLPLLARQPGSNKLVSALCSHWHINQADRRFYCRLNAQARWSDGVQVSSSDIAFTLDFLSNPASQSPAVRQRLLSYIKQLEIFDDQAFALQLHPQPTPGVIDAVRQLRPAARHFYQSRQGWPDAFNELAEPSTGPYYLESLTRADRFSLRKSNNWWLAEQAFFSRRFNVNKIEYRYIADPRRLLEKFRAGEIDALPLNQPDRISQQDMLILSQHYKINLVEHYSQQTERLTGLLLSDQALLQPVAANPGQPLSQQLRNKSLNIAYAGRLRPAELERMAVQLESDGVQVRWQPVTNVAPDTLLQQQPFTAIWLSTQRSMLADIERRGQHFFAAGSDRARSRYIAWRWLQFPAQIASPASDDLMLASDAEYGGAFWINPEIRIDTLASPARRQPRVSTLSNKP